MTKMSETQRAAVIEAHEKRTDVFGGMVMAKLNTLKALSRNGWIFSIYGLPTRAGLIAAGVDMDAIHAEALEEDTRREMDKVAAEQSSPAYKHFVKAVYQERRGYRAAIDILHAEAWEEDRAEHFGRTLVEHDGKMTMIQDIPDRWIRAQLGYGHPHSATRSMVPVAGREWKATPDTCTYGELGWEWTDLGGKEYLVCPRCGLDGT